MGSFAVELYTKQAPKTCKNFIELARKGYYDGTIVSMQPRGPSLGTLTSILKCTGHP